MLSKLSIAKHYGAREVKNVPKRLKKKNFLNFWKYLWMGCDKDYTASRVELNLGMLLHFVDVDSSNLI